MIRSRANSLSEIAKIRLRDGSGLFEYQRVWLRGADGVTRLIWSAAASMTVSAEPDQVDGAAARNFPTSITTSQSTATVSGGATPLTYVWSLLGGDDWAITAPNSPTTAFRANGVPAGETVGASFSCTVTDRFGNTATSNIVTATATNYGDQTGGPIP